MKNIKIKIGYNEDSFINSSFVRVVNYFLLAITVLLLIKNIDTVFDTDNKSVYENYNITKFFIEIIVTSFISTSMAKRAIKDTEFFEWDYTERKKKLYFCTTYSNINIIFTGLFVHTIAYIIYNYKLWSISPIFLLLVIFFALYFLFNMFNIVSLYFFIFKDCLTQAYKIQKKPENWQNDENGVLIPNEEPFEERIHREFGL